MYADNALAIWSTIDRLKRAGQVLGRAAYLCEYSTLYPRNMKFLQLIIRPGRASYAYKDEEWDNAYVTLDIRKRLRDEKRAFVYVIDEPLTLGGPRCLVCHRCNCGHQHLRDLLNELVPVSSNTCIDKVRKVQILEKVDRRMVPYQSKFRQQCYNILSMRRPDKNWDWLLSNNLDEWKLHLELTRPINFLNPVLNDLTFSNSGRCYLFI